MYKLLRGRDIAMPLLIIIVALSLSVDIGMRGGAVLTGAVVAVDHAPDEGKIQLPVIMYHSILKSRNGKYVISPEELENDLKYIQREGFHTVTVNDLIKYVYNDVPLPEKPMMITFDDGFLNNMTYGEPLLREYGMRAVVSIVGKYTDESAESSDHNPAYAYLNWEDVQSLQQEGVMELQSHSYDLHSMDKGRKGASKKKFEDIEKYRDMLCKDIHTFNEAVGENTGGYTTTAFTYPFGQYCEESESIIKEEGFLASLSCTERIHIISKNPESLYHIGRFNRPSGISSAKFFKNVLRNYKEPVNDMN